jgi:hypothetical protein
MQRAYRKERIGLGEWHFDPRCADWPKNDFIEQLDVPEIDELCQNCVALIAPADAILTRVLKRRAGLRLR